MNRRSFLSSLVLGPVVAPVVLKETPKLAIDWGFDPPVSFAFTACGGDLGRGTLPGLIGIPYHHNNGTAGTWLGLKRDISSLAKLEMDYESHEVHVKALRDFEKARQ